MAPLFSTDASAMATSHNQHLTLRDRLRTVPASALGLGSRPWDPHLGLLAKPTGSVRNLGERTELLPRDTGGTNCPCNLLATAGGLKRFLDCEQGPLVELDSPGRNLGDKGFRLRTQQSMVETATLIPAVACPSINPWRLAIAGARVASRDLPRVHAPLAAIN